MKGHLLVSKSPTTDGQSLFSLTVFSPTLSTSVQKKKKKGQGDKNKSVHGLPKRSHDKTYLVPFPSSLSSSLGRDMKNKVHSAIEIGLLVMIPYVKHVRCAAVSTFILSMTALLMFPPKARSSLGVGGLGPNSANPFFFSSSTLAAAGPLAFISFLNTQKLYTLL